LGDFAFSDRAGAIAAGAIEFFVFVTGWVVPFIEHFAFALFHALSASAIGIICCALAQIVQETLLPVVLDDLAMFETTSRATRFLVVAAILFAL